MLKTLALKLCSICVSLLLVIQLAGCGTLLYPERRGQTSGDIDPGVAILNGIGLLFFIIPGLVAYAIDFSTGAIYLPPNRKAELESVMALDGLRVEQENGRTVVHVDPDRLTPELVDTIVEAATGVTEGTSHSRLEVYRLDDDSSFAGQFRRFAGDTGGSTLRFN